MFRPILEFMNSRHASNNSADVAGIESRSRRYEISGGMGDSGTTAATAAVAAAVVLVPVVVVVEAVAVEAAATAAAAAAVVPVVTVTVSVGTSRLITLANCYRS